MAGRLRQGLRAAAWGAVAAGVSAGSAHALIIAPVFDSSITGLANAGVVEQAFRTAASVYDADLATSATINVDVGWGKVDGSAVRSGALGVSVDPLYGYFTYAQIRSWLPLSDVLPGNPASGTKYAMPAAEAKALGLVTATHQGVDGYIGFGLSPSSYSYTVGTTAAGTYNFIDVAEHELAEVLGRISGIGDGFATPFDLFRYARNTAGKAAASFSGSATTYFSINGGATQDGPPFNSAGSGDRADWASTPTSTDIQDSFLYPGATPRLSQADLDGLDALGFRPSAAQSAQQWVAQPGSAHFALIAEPASVSVFGMGLLGLLPWTARRRRRWG